jgi:hypothetical protein
MESKALFVKCQLEIDIRDNSESRRVALVSEGPIPGRALIRASNVNGSAVAN